MVGPTTTTTISARPPREIDNVLWRVPAQLKQLAEETAKGSHLSQNAYISTSVLFTSITWGILPVMGDPDNAILLLNEMDKADADSDAVLGAFHYQDWLQIQPLVNSFVAGDIITGYKTRQDANSRETVAYTFTFTKAGQAAWKQMGPKLRAFLVSSKKG